MSASIAAESANPRQMLGRPKGAGRLAAALRRLSGWRKVTLSPRVELAPGCSFGMVVDERLKAMERQIGEVKDRLNGLIYVVLGAVVVEIIMRFMK